MNTQTCTLGLPSSTTSLSLSLSPPHFSPASAGLASLPTGCVHYDSGVMNMNGQRSLQGRSLGHDLQQEEVRR